MVDEANGRTSGVGITRIEAVRQTLGKLGKDANRSDLQTFIKDNYGFQVTLDHISNCKRTIRKAKGLKKPAEAKPPALAKEEPKQAMLGRPGGGVSRRDIERVKDLAYWQRFTAQGLRLIA